MTYDEALKVLTILKGAYPNSYRGLTTEEAKLTATIWATHFVKVPFNIVMIAVNKSIKKSNFPPSIKEVSDIIGGLDHESQYLLKQHRDATVGVKMFEGDDPFKTGKALSENVVNQLKEIQAFFRNDDYFYKSELVEILEGFGGNMLGQNSAEQKRLGQNGAE